MNAKILLLCFSILILLSCKGSQQLSQAQKSFLYNYKVDLTEFRDDQLAVELRVEGLKSDTLSFCFPKIVPGIYGAMDFGQYITSLEVKDQEGNSLPIVKEGINCWKIGRASSISQIAYKVDDIWETFDFGMKEGLYGSAASSFSDSAFVINNNCLFGYFRGLEGRPFMIEWDRPSNFYGASSLVKTNPVAEKDVFYSPDYHTLVDNPILYAKPDTSLIKLPGIEVEVACYSTSGTSISKGIADYIRPVLINQSKYLGGKLPVDKYTFIIFHNLNPDKNSYMGDGLEHSQSTLILYYMPDNLNMIKEGIYGVASHEFFHILMPLGIHSKEIANYDFNRPKFSRHLWLYEGMTEYFTIHMPIKTGVQSLENFCGVLERKLKESKDFDSTLPLTKLSLDPMNMQDQYYNVYLKGALVNLCLDIYLRELSSGAYGVQDLVADLIDKYGPEKAFEDEKLFEEIVKLTGFVEVREFFKKYVEGGEEIPLKKMLEKVGLELKEGTIKILASLNKDQQQLRRYWINQ